MDWKVKTRFEHAYARSLKNIIKQIEGAVSDTSDPYEIVRRLRAMPNSKAYIKYCERLSCTMVTNLNKDVMDCWRKAARENGKGNEIYRISIQELNNGLIGAIINEQIAINAAMIKSLIPSIAEKTADKIKDETFRGLRASEIAEMIKKDFPKETNASAELIARTEVSKTRCALIKARSESLGMDWYIWRTSKDERVRSSHDFMDGVLVRWRDPPNPEALDPKGKQRAYGNYHAGNTFNCRCYPEPVIDIKLIKFPHKVYYNGKITNMKKAEFLRIA